MNPRGGNGAGRGGNRGTHHGPFGIIKGVRPGGPGRQVTPVPGLGRQGECGRRLAGVFDQVRLVLVLVSRKLERRQSGARPAAARTGPSCGVSWWCVRYARP